MELSAAETISIPDWWWLLKSDCCRALVRAVSVSLAKASGYHESERVDLNIHGSIVAKLLDEAIVDYGLMF